MNMQHCDIVDDLLFPAEVHPRFLQLHWFLPNTLSQRLAHCRTGGMKAGQNMEAVRAQLTAVRAYICFVRMQVNVMTLSGDCMATSFDQSDTMRDLALWIRRNLRTRVGRWAMR